MPTKFSQPSKALSEYFTGKEKPNYPVTFDANGEAWLFDGLHSRALSGNYPIVCDSEAICKNGGIYFDGWQSGGVLTDSNALVDGNPFTLVFDAWIENYQFSANDRIVDCKTAWNSSDGFTVAAPSTTSLQIFGNGGTGLTISNAWDIANGKIRFVLRYDGTTMYLDSYNGASNSYTKDINAATYDVAVLRAAPSSGNAPVGIAQYLAYYHDFFDDGKVESLLANPYQDLKPQIDPAYYYTPVVYNTVYPLPDFLTPGFDGVNKPTIPCDSIIDAYYHYNFNGTVINLGKHNTGQSNYTQIGTAEPIRADGAYAEDATTSYIEFPIESNMSNSGHWAGMLMIVRFKNLIAIGDWTGIFASSTAANTNLWYLDKRTGDTYNTYMGSVGSASATLPSWVKSAGSDVTVIYASKQASTAQKHNTKMIFLNNKTGEYQVENYSAADTWSGDGATDHIMMLGQSESAYGVIDSTVFTHFSLQENIFGLNEDALVGYASNLWTNTLKPQTGMLYYPASGGTTNNLLANDVESSSELSSPSIGQVHALLASDIESSSEVSTPSVTTDGTDDLLANDVESSSEVSSPTLSQAHALLASDIESASEISSPVAGQEHALLGNDAESASEVTTPTLLEAGHALLADDLESASEVSIPIIGQAHVLLANDAESASEISSPILAQIHQLTTNNVESVSEVSTPTAGIASDDLLAEDLESASEISTPTLAQVHVLYANDVESASEVSVPTVTPPVTLADLQQQITDLTALVNTLIEYHGLDPSNPHTISRTSRTSTNVNQTITDNGDGSVTLQAS